MVQFVRNSDGICAIDLMLLRLGAMESGVSGGGAESIEYASLN